MTSSAAPPATAAPHASRLHITTTTTGTGPSTITSPSSHHSPSSARSPHSASSSPRGSSTGTGGGSGSGGSGGSGSGSTNQACAACKYQRRKCNPDCPLAPYFPADQQRRFLNAHRLFGVSNILKTLKRLSPDMCADAMATLIYQSDMRAQDPVGGCYRLIATLERQHELDTAELSAVLHHLALCRQAATAIPPQEGGMADLDVTSSNQPLLLNAEPEVVDALYANHEADTAILQTDIHHHDHGDSPQDHGEHAQQQQQLFDYFYYDATASDDASSKPTIDINLDNMQQFDFDDTCAAEKVDLAPEEIGQQHLDVNCQIDHKDYEIKAAALVDAFDMRQELQPVDVNADVDVKAVDVNAGIGVDIKAVDVNANVDVNVDLQEEDANNIAAGESAQMAAESSRCRLGLGFSSF
ncbi:LOB domain-containing protein 22 [Dichanthelium oligosanthes]|uniref:LOB domain-containing protein 22 n=1 Tax=Dichanthelium oligosanthes TaxID=888268 RepID=A0A1E5VM40_9POAL|nr:LOB domain-containing protein 22 [Dichanthelium oligosanthes]